MSANFGTRPRILSSNAHKYLGRNVTIIGEVISINPTAATLTLRMPDEESIIVLLSKNATTVEPNLLTEVSGKLVSKGQVESSHIKQWSPKATSIFNKTLYREAVNFYDAHMQHFDI